MVCIPSLGRQNQKQHLLTHPIVSCQTNHTSNETTLPSKTNRPNKRPITDERSVNERANKQSKTAERDPSFVPEQDDEGSQFSEGEDIAHDSSVCHPSSSRDRIEIANKHAVGPHAWSNEKFGELFGKD